MFFEFDLVLGFEDGTGTTVGVSHLFARTPLDVVSLQPLFPLVAVVAVGIIGSFQRFAH